MRRKSHADEALLQDVREHYVTEFMRKCASSTNDLDLRYILNSLATEREHGHDDAIADIAQLVETYQETNIR